MCNIHGGKFLGYTYENMENDLGIFLKTFPEYICADSLGRTADNRKIYHFVIGRQDAQEKVFFFGGIHGREYMTSQLLMEQTVEFLAFLSRKQRTYQGKSYEKLMEGRAIHVIPMANPDGVSISQFGAEGIRDKNLRELVQRIAAEEKGRMPCGSYFNRWKANARGVDLNRNFDACWEQQENGKDGPSSEGYRGLLPESETESRLLADLTRKEKFLRTISYHSSGQVIYWNFGQEGELKEQNETFAQRIAKVTGYRVDKEWTLLTPAGYKDWAVSKMQIPSLTVEIGKQESPLPGHSFREILRENRGVWEETLLDLS